MPTASGDADGYVAGFYRSFATLDCQPADLQLFRRNVAGLHSFVLDQDVIYVGGGNTANLLAVWRVHELDRVLRRAWEHGVVLCGVSRDELLVRAVPHRLLWPYAARAASRWAAVATRQLLPHYDDEAQRRPTFRRMAGEGDLAAGWAADDGAALVFAGDQVKEVVASRPGANAYRVEKTCGGATERCVPSRYLGV